MNEMILILSVKAILITLIVLIYRNKKLKKREFEKQLKQSKHVTEREKIRVYIDKINEATRAKHR